MERTPEEMEAQFDQLIRNLKSKNADVRMCAEVFLEGVDVGAGSNDYTLSKATAYRLKAIFKDKLCCKCGKPAARIADDRKSELKYLCHSCSEERTTKPIHLPRIYSFNGEGEEYQGDE